MADTTPTPSDPKKIQDFETEESSPTIKRYTNDIKPATPAAAATPAPVAKVNPTGPAPTTQAPVAPAPAPIAKPGVSAPKPVPVDPAAKKKAILGCLGGFGGLMLIFLILSFVFLAQTGNGTSPIAKLLGINEGVFINGLITFVHVIFILISLVAFVFTMVGLFKASMVRSDDKDGRKAALRSSLISGVLLFAILIIWGFTFVYLDSKRVLIDTISLQPIVTVPEKTLGLTAPIEIKFDASNVPFDKNNFSIVSHDWDFGDKSTGTSQIASHIYKEKGTYDVKLVITVKDKNTGKLSTGGEYHTTVSIENLALSALFTADAQSGEAPFDVNFDASTSADPDGTIEKYEWDFTGDGQYKDGTGKTIKHTFDKIGKYKVSLRVTSTTGRSNTSDKEINVVESITPVAVIKVVDEPKAYSLGQSYVFNGDDSTSPNGNITKYEWTFSDNPTKPESTKTVSHIFKAPGTYQVTLKVTDEKGKTSDIQKVITIDAPKGVPKAKISTTPAFDAKTGTITGKAPFTVAFDSKNTTDSDNNIVDYKWDFNGDGTFDAFGPTTSHTFTDDGSFNVVLNAVDADKNVGSATMTVKVEAQGIIPNLSADVLDGNIPLSVNFDASASSYAKGQISGYKWDFGDGTPVKMGSATLTHKYTAIGTFTAVVTVLGSDNTSATKSVTINVREIPLNACFLSVFEKGPAPLNTSFDPSCSTGTATSYSWDFGDGTTSTQVKPSHSFTKAGTYKVVLELSDAQNTISKSEVTITVTEK
ncbi:MAG: PKD domain-containing protein [Candidatus Peregrinibacteria bacterium]|nr:PKD domain-containing protein [Candidatus Peregrinibacteria bacterium]